jgi:PAS domain S-box-containing protein
MKLIESELYQTEEIFKEFLDNISSGVMIYETTDSGKNFKIIEMNKAALDSCQVSREDVLGKDLIEVFPNIAEFGFVDILRKVLKTGKPEHSPTSLYQDDRVSGWTEMYIYKLPSKKIVALFEKQTKLIQTEENFKKKVEFEKAISTVSSQFVDPMSIDDAINNSLKKIGLLSKSSRSYLFIFNEENKTMSNTHEWCDEGVIPQIDQIQNVPLDVFPWSINKLKNGEILNIDDVENLPPEASSEKEEFLRENIKSLVFLPIKIGQQISGFIGFDNVKISKKWSEDDLNLLKITSDLIGNALKHMQTDQELARLNKELENGYKQRTKELEETEEKFKTLADQSLMGIFIIQDNKTLYANQKIAEMFGYSFEQVMNMTLEDQLTKVHPEDRKLVEEQATKKQKGDKDVINQYQFRYFKESGELMWIEVYSKTIFYGGKPANFVTFVDITDQKKIEAALQESESEKSAILESLLEHIVYQTKDNTIIYANKSAADSVNMTPDQLVGHKCYQVWNTLEEPCEGCPVVKAIESNKPAIDEITTPDGRIWYVGGYPVRDKENNIIGVVESTLNITEKKTAEEKIKKSEEKYRKAYYQANLYRDIFAHDINNILQNISSSVELSALYLNNPGKLSTIKDLYEIVDEQVNRAKKLILNVRKITELDESDLILGKMDANRVLNKAIDFLQSSFQTRNIDIQLNTPTKRNYVYTNNLLLDIFENLLINAVRHNNKSKIEIIIDISKEKKEDKNYLKMEFKDNGVGISDYRKKSIFERGTRKRQKTKGMGLGLSLVKKIIDIYNGEIWVEDRVKGDYKQGSNFVVLIPTIS